MKVHPELLDFISNRLSCGAGCSRAARQCNLMRLEGKFQPIPNALNLEDVDQLSRLEFGGVADRGESIETLSRVVMALVTRHPGHVFVMENTLARPADSANSRFGSNVVYSGDDVYTFITAASTPPASRLIKLASYADSFAGFLMPIVEEPIRAENLVSSTPKSVMVAIGACDGEAYLLWTRAPIDIASLIH